MSLLLRFWWPLLVLIGSFATLKTLDPDHKDDILKDSVQDNDVLHDFYRAVEKALPQLLEVRSSFERLREQFNHIHTLDEMLENFDQPQYGGEIDLEEELEEDEQAWKESTKAWVLGIEENMAKNGINLDISKLEWAVNETTTNEEESQKQEDKEEAERKRETHGESKLGKDSSVKKENVHLPEASVIKEKLEDPATNNNFKDTGNQISFSEQKTRSKRSLKENLEEQPEQLVVAKHRTQMLDDFEDHNGNRANFGVVGNGMLTPDADELGEKSLFLPGHEQLAHYMNLESNPDFDFMAHVYDPTKNMVPLINQQFSAVAPQQQPQQLQVQAQQQQPQSQGKSSQFKASFNLNNIFNDLQKLSHPPAQPAAAQPPSNPVLVQQPMQQYKPPVAQSSHRYYGPFGNRQQQKLNVDPNCMPITVIPPNCPTGSPGAAIPNPPPPPPPGPGSATNGPGSATTNSPSQPTDVADACKYADSVKMNVAINANVCADPKTKLFSGNGSISVLPAPGKLYSDIIYQSQEPQLDEGEAKSKDERYARDVSVVLNEGTSNYVGEINEEQKKPRRIDDSMETASGKRSEKKQKKGKSKKKKASKKATTKSTVKARKNEKTKCDRLDKPTDKPSSLDKMVSGKLFDDIVDAVFEAIGCDPEMERLVSVLQRNRHRTKQPKDFYQIRTDKNENVIRQTEIMVRDTMEAISEIIEQQISRRACIPLRPDLIEFYDLILKTAAEEKKVREKRQSSMRVLSAEFTEDVHLLDPPKINENIRIVKKLLHQYQDLPLTDQLAAVKTHDQLLLDLEYLRKMDDTVERRKRNSRMQDVVKQQTLDEGLEHHVNNEYSPRFVKLLKTAELFMESGETMAKDRI